MLLGRGQTGFVALLVDGSVEVARLRVGEPLAVDDLLREAYDVPAVGHVESVGRRSES